MFKSRLQELCQKRGWELPEYTTVKDGPDHIPLFRGCVNLRGMVFETPEPCRSSKEAQNTAARLAYDHFNVAPPPRAQPRPPPARAGVTYNPQFYGFYGAPGVATYPPRHPGVNPQFHGGHAATAGPTVYPGINPQFYEASVAVIPPMVPPGVDPQSSQVEVAIPPSPSPIVPPVAVEPILVAVEPIAVATEPITVATEPIADARQIVLPPSPPPSSLPLPAPGLLAPKNNINAKHDDLVASEKNSGDNTQTSVVQKIAISSPDKIDKGLLNIYKSRLQQYVQKKNLGLPVYTCEFEGPPHCRRFKSRVSFNGKSFETLEFFPTLKEAEQAAAKIAWEELSDEIIQEDGGLYKSLLQEYSQKKGLRFPSYETVKYGLSHQPFFVSSVEIGSDVFQGAEANTKKQAEMNAAKVAFSALVESRPAAQSSGVAHTKESPVADNLTLNVQHTTPTKKRQDEIGEGRPAAQSSGVAHMKESPVADNLTQNVQHTTTTKKHQDEIDEEVHAQAKRAKSSPGNMNMNAHVPTTSHSDSVPDGSSSPPSQVGSSSIVTQQPVEDQSPLQRKTVVFPRKLNMPIPECASVMPFSNDQWVAYKVRPIDEPSV